MNLRSQLSALDPTHPSIKHSVERIQREIARMPSVLRKSGPPIERNGVATTPRALVSTCEVCGDPAPFGDNSSGKLLTWCAAHNPNKPERSKEAA